MITYWNRTALIVTLSMQKQAAVRRVLAANHIEYTLKTVSMDKANHSSFGHFRMDIDHSCEYTIYVKKEDYEKAASFLKA